MSIRTKICGLRTTDAIIASQDHGAEFLGFIFFPPSPRDISPSDAGKIAKVATAKKVAVVVDASDELLDDIVENLKPDYIQLHGKETEARAKEIKDKYSIPLFRSCDPNDYPESDLYDYLVVDPSHGQGKTFDWNNFIQPKQDFFLSGGLTPNNIEEAVELTGAKLIDVSSGIESMKGVKDIGLIKELLDKANSL